MTRRSVDPAVARTSADVLRERARALRAEADAAERMADAADAAVGEGALEQFQDETLARVEASVAAESARAAESVPDYRNRTGPHDDRCPNCGAQAYDDPDDPQKCGECGTRVCPVCGADFAEEYDDAQDRISDNLGEHVRRWHPEVAVAGWADAVMTMIDRDIAAGLVPAAVASFSALHESRDANVYVIDALAGSFEVPEHYGDEYHDGSKLTERDQAIVDAEHEAANAVMDEVNRRLAARFAARFLA